MEDQITAWNLGIFAAVCLIYGFLPGIYVGMTIQRCLSRRVCGRFARWFRGR